jgi:hypothetical protein
MGTLAGLLRHGGLTQRRMLVLLFHDTGFRHPVTYHQDGRAQCLLETRKRGQRVARALVRLCAIFCHESELSRQERMSGHEM